MTVVKRTIVKGHTINLFVHNTILSDMSLEIFSIKKEGERINKSKSKITSMKY